MVYHISFILAVILTQVITGTMVAIKDSLAVIYLFSGEMEVWERFVLAFSCSVDNLNRFILQNTPAHFYIFYRHQPTNNMTSKFPSSGENRIHFIKINDSDWTLPKDALKKQAEWYYQPFSESYRMMGHWRLVFPFKFARDLGHEYLLFIDDDSFVTSSFDENIVQHLRQANMSFAYRGLHKDKKMTLYLPELTLDFMKKSKMVPGSLLYKDCIPQNISAFRSWNDSLNIGWESTVMSGNFVIISLEFWFQPIIQEYLEFILQTNMHIIMRWNEQSILGMMRLLFIESHQEKQLYFGYEHGLRLRNNKQRRKQWCRNLNSSNAPV